MYFYNLDSIGGGGGLAGIIISAAATIIGAITTFIYKCRGRSWREIFKSVVEGQNEDIKELSKTLVEQGKVVGSIIEKELEKKKEVKK